MSTLFANLYMLLTWGPHTVCHKDPIYISYLYDQMWLVPNVSNKNCNSSMSNIILGVPQGSVWGSVYFFFCISMTCTVTRIRTYSPTICVSRIESAFSQ